MTTRTLPETYGIAGTCPTGWPAEGRPVQTAEALILSTRDAAEEPIFVNREHRRSTIFVNRRHYDVQVCDKIFPSS